MFTRMSGMGNSKGGALTCLVP